MLSRMYGLTSRACTHYARMCVHVLVADICTYCWYCLEAWKHGPVDWYLIPSVVGCIFFAVGTRVWVRWVSRGLVRCRAQGKPATLLKKVRLHGNGMRCWTPGPTNVVVIFDVNNLFQIFDVTEARSRCTLICLLLILKIWFGVNCGRSV